jgi:hypothetical protein
MDQQTIIIIAALAGIAGIFASLAILRRYRVPKESPFAVSTEGEKRRPNCGMGNRSWMPAASAAEPTSQAEGQEDIRRRCPSDMNPGGLG